MTRRRAGPLLPAVAVALCGALAAAPAAAAPPSCYQALDALAVPYSIPARGLAGVDWPAEVDGPLGGITYVPLGAAARAATGAARVTAARPLVLDCSLVYSLAVAGKMLYGEGVRTASFGD